MSELLAKCEVCGSLLDEEDLFCANCGTESPRRKAEPEPQTDSSRLATHNFECSGCGASMSYDARAGSLRCPFCGSVDMVPQQDAKILSPRRVVPFRLGREEAVAAMRRWLGRGFFRPHGLSQQASVVQMQPVYVPYWVFQATTHTYSTADTDRTPPGAQGDWYPLAGEHHGRYENLLIGASRALSPAETSKICPFNLAEGVAPEQIDLENVTVEQFSVPRKYARPLARGALEQLEVQAADDEYVPGRSRNVHANVRIESMSSEPVLLPVWIMAYRYGDRVYRFLVNGQSGQATGQAPVSWLKILMIPVIILAVVLIVWWFLGRFGGAGGFGRNGTEGPNRRIEQPRGTPPPGGGDSSGPVATCFLALGASQPDRRAESPRTAAGLLLYWPVGQHPLALRVNRAQHEPQTDPPAAG
jgi:predicted RNA-binding Zn-ribbon protein involved in translation (DUF1610 family)